MVWVLALYAFVLCFIPCYPMYRYFWRLIWQNGDEFAPAYQQEHGKDLERAVLLGGRGLADNVAERFAYASLAVFIVPLIPHSAVATSFTSCCCG